MAYSAVAMLVNVLIMAGLDYDHKTRPALNLAFIDKEIGRCLRTTLSAALPSQEMSCVQSLDKSLQTMVNKVRRASKSASSLSSRILILVFVSLVDSDSDGSDIDRVSALLKASRFISKLVNSIR